MKRLPAPDILIRQWLHNPHAITVAAFAIAGLFLGLAGWFIQRNLRHNEPGLRLPFALPFALIIAAAGVFGAWRLPSPYGLFAGSVICGLAGSKEMGPSDHIRTKHEVKAFVESGDVKAAESLLKLAQERRAHHQAESIKQTQQQGQRMSQ